MKRVLALTMAVAIVALANHGSRQATAGGRFLVPARFYPQALCVHSGWHWKRAWSRWEKRHAGYRFGPFFFRRTWDVPDAIAGGAGEGSWTADNYPYGGGMQFMLSTWHRAGGRGRSTSAIAAASPAEQIYRAYRIVRMDGGSWGEWPNTSRACGLR